MAETDQITSDELPIYDKPTIPADAEIIMLVEEPNYDFGGTLSAAYRLPISRIVANNQIQGNVYTIADETAGITIAENTVVPAYVENFDPFHLKRAQASSNTTKARFLILGENVNVDGGYLVQSNGYYVFPEDHAYLVGQTYYLSDSAPGGVTNVAPGGIVQPLFHVIDSKTIQIAVGL